MRVDGWVLTAICLLLGVATGCEPKVGGKCAAEESYCSKGGALLCGDDGKLVATSCKGPSGCVQHGKVAACDQSLAVAGERCDNIDNIACSVDKKAELECKAHKWVIGATCKGAKGCELKGDELFCDHTLADKDDPCRRDGQIACTNDKTFLLKCEGNVMHAVDSCRGPKSCTFEEKPALELVEFSCDDSVAQEGDPCETDNNHACAVDKKAIHVCKDHRFVSLRACAGPRGCTFDPAAEKLSCDIGGGGSFVGAGGSAKVSSSAGAAGGTGKAKSGAAASASAKKPAASATVTASASAKPAVTASAAASASGKPAASASGKPAATSKPTTKKR